MWNQHSPTMGGWNNPPPCSLNASVLNDLSRHDVITMTRGPSLLDLQVPTCGVTFTESAVWVRQPPRTNHVQGVVLQKRRGTLSVVGMNCYINCIHRSSSGD